MKSLGLARDDAKPGKAYGKKGTLFAAPVDLVLDETTMTRLLDRIGEGGKKMKNKTLHPAPFSDLVYSAGLYHFSLVRVPEK